jgi:hypothetical protein
MQSRAPLAAVAFVLLIVLAWAVDYFLLPAYNLGAVSFWVLGGCGLALLGVVAAAAVGSPKPMVYGAIAGTCLVILAFAASMGSWLVFPGNDKRYAALLAETAYGADDFAAEFSGADLILPTIDKELSVKLAQARLGPYGAQFSLNEDIFTAVAVDGPDGVRVLRNTPLDYSGLFVALAGKGSVGYLQVDQVSAEARLVETPQRLFYSPGAVFGRDLARLVRFADRTALLGDFSFEIDDSGKPYWIVPILKRTIGLFGGSQPDGIFLVDPASGSVERFAAGAEPAWIDRTAPTSVVLEQADARLSLAGGWVNKYLGQKRDVFQLSDGYNYAFSRSGGVGRTWLVSGVTSPSEADQTLTGFMLINMKTKEARRYPIGGITEMRAMEIAENDERVRAQTLTATWPILTSLGGEPVFFLFLKNQVQRQRFVYVDASSGARVAMGETHEAAAADYARLVGSRADPAAAAAETSGQVLRVRAEGAANEFLLAGDAYRYAVDRGLSNGSRFLQAGDRVALRYRESAAGDGVRFVVELRNLTLQE